MRPLDYYKNKVIRYWLVGGSDVCSYGRLISWDNLGILIGATDEGFKEINGSEFYHWNKIKCLGYFDGDDE